MRQMMAAGQSRSIAGALCAPQSLGYGVQFLLGSVVSVKLCQKTPQGGEFRTRAIDAQKVVHIGIGGTPAGRGIGFVSNESASGIEIANERPAIAIGATVDVE